MRTKLSRPCIKQKNLTKTKNKKFDIYAEHTVAYNG